MNDLECTSLDPGKSLRMFETTRLPFTLLWTLVAVVADFVDFLLRGGPLCSLFASTSMKAESVACQSNQKGGGASVLK